MITESRVRIPQEGTKRSKVFKTITEQEIPVWETRQIARITGLTVRETTVARANLRRDGYLPKPDSKLTRLTQHTQAATVLPLVKEYREMGLSLREIQLAVKIEKGVELSYSSVHSAIVYGTKKGNLRRLSKEEDYDISSDANVNTLTPERILENITAILKLRKLFLKNNRPLPTNRLEWKIAIIAKKTSFIKNQIGEDERSIWEYAVHHGLLPKIIQAGMITEQELTLIRSYFEQKKTSGKDFTVETFNKFTIAVARFA